MIAAQYALTCDPKSLEHYLEIAAKEEWSIREDLDSLGSGDEE
jgi:hypothetical protein